MKISKTSIKKIKIKRLTNLAKKNNLKPENCTRLGILNPQYRKTSRILLSHNQDAQTLSIRSNLKLLTARLS